MIKKIILKKAVDKSLQADLAWQLDRKQIEQLKTLSQVVLAVVGVAGIIAISAVAPNVLAAAGHYAGLRKKFKGLAADEKLKKFERTFYYLRSSGLVKFHGEPSDLKISLTDKAKKLIGKLGFRTMQVKKPKKWDEKWW
ncbi:MAG: hypothetical protein ACHQVK_03490, partial [Candidatus Paceibacterales bacterium]